MATLLKTSTANSYSPTYLSKGTGTTSRNTSEFFFFSDNPESLTENALADKGKWLNKATVKGTGQIYLWHHNSTGSTIKSGLLIYNSNSFAIKVTVPNYGTTLGTARVTVTDGNAWKNYFQGKSTSVTIAAGAYGNLFLQTISNDCDFGTVAKASITNSSTGASASAVFYDYAYISNASGATAAATAVKDFKRGHGNGFYQTINFAAIPYGSETTKKAYTIGASMDTFSGADCSTITDDSGAASGLLEGAFGQVLAINLPIKNNTSSSRAFKVFIGTISGANDPNYKAFSFPFVYMNGDIANYSNIWAPKKQFVDVIQTGPIGANTTATVSFSTVIPAVSSTPYVIGVYPI